MSITFSSCFYIIKSKFAPSKYIEWMNNFISIVNKFNLVIYTDENSSKYINTKNNPKIMIIIKPLENFYNYKFKDFWVNNHTKNFLLSEFSCWELNMLWSEKIWLVKETIERKYFESEFYGWCDIGYFRNRHGQLNDTHTKFLSNWPNNDKINKINKDKIVYACINNNDHYMNDLIKIINNKDKKGLPIIPIPPYQLSISGGFFILHKNMIHWWTETYNSKLELYFKNNYLVKDDQVILADCIFSNLDKFTLFRENNIPYDNWFMFQRILN
jgi:hypothetical protein